MGNTFGEQKDGDAKGRNRNSARAKIFLDTFRDSDMRKPNRKLILIWKHKYKPNRNRFTNKHGKGKFSVHDWSDSRRVVKQRYPWLNHGDNFDYYSSRKQRKANQPKWKAISGSPYEFNYEKDYVKEANANFHHKRFKKIRNDYIKDKHYLAKKRKAQLKVWRNKGSNGKKPIYPTHLGKRRIVKKF